MENMDEFKQIFFTECAELLSDMEERLLKMDEGTQDSEQLNAIFRCAHSIKGGAGAFGLDPIMRFTHTLEALLDAMREGSLLPTRESIDALLKSADIVTQMLNAAKEGREISEDASNQMTPILQGFAKGSGGAAAPVVKATPKKPAEPEKEHFKITFEPKPELFSTGNEPLLILRELEKLGDAEISADISSVLSLESLNPTQSLIKWNVHLSGNVTEGAIKEVFEFVEDVCSIAIEREEVIGEVEVNTEDLHEVAATHAPQPAVAAAPKKADGAEQAAPKAASAGTTSIRVDLDKVDRLVNMVGELVITEAMLRAKTRNVPPEVYAELMRGMDELSHHTRELQEAVMAVRMQPVKSIFSRMPRVVRDTASQLGKEIQLIMTGENTEVDKTVIEQLGDPLTHMIRNSCDHGIETPDQRVWFDKPIQGTIHLSAYHRSGRIIIEIADDGAGINRDRVLAKAKEKGLVPEDAQPTPEEIDHMVFMPGFSTAEKVTSVSGRGVGMDVVKRNIESLGGTVRITNNPGKGSVFTVSLPLTLAILDGMIVRIGQEDYIIPIANIIETLRPNKDDIHYVQSKGDVINVRGEFIPLVYLNKLFNIPGAISNRDNALIVLVESGSEKLGLVVDELMGQQQVVIKSLADNADPVKGISGATILGDGKVSLILEINELKSLCQTRPMPAPALAA